MITLYGFGPAFGLADPSPFVVKAEVLLKLAGVDYRLVRGIPRKAPKKKLPYIDDDGTIVADSTLIRLHLERTRGIDLDKGLSDYERGVAWTIEKMLEDHVYWLLMHERWHDRANFDRGPRQFFQAVPLPLRPVVVAMIRRTVARNLQAQGTGRFEPAERETIARRSIGALSACLGDKPWMMGDNPTALDAAAHAFVSGALCPLFPGPVNTAVSSHPNLVAYAERSTARWQGAGA